jgi:streptomycin 6-kinase
LAWRQRALPRPVRARTVIAVPPAFASSLLQVSNGSAADWLAQLPSAVADVVARWDLVLEPTVLTGLCAVVLPVQQPDRRQCVLKLPWPHPEAEPEPVALTAWAGHGAVLLLDHDAGTGALLLERLDAARDLETGMPADEATATVGALTTLLHIPAPDGVPSIAATLARWTAELRHRHVRVGSPFPDRWLDETIETIADGVHDPRLVHGDLHYMNVLAGERAPWLAIDPQASAADRAYDVAPVLWNRWADLLAAPEFATAVRRRVAVFCDAAGIDQEDARRWSLARVVESAVWSAEVGLVDEVAKNRAICAALAS